MRGGPNKGGGGLGVTRGMLANRGGGSQIGEGGGEKEPWGPGRLLLCQGAAGCAQHGGLGSEGPPWTPPKIGTPPQNRDPPQIKWDPHLIPPPPQSPFSGPPQRRFSSP